MVTDDNEADGALSGEAGETSFQPWVLIYTFNFKSI